MAKTLRDIAPKKQVLGDVDGQFKGVKSSKTAPMNLDAWEKMPDSRDFIAKHEVETHADRVGNGDDVYKGKTKEAKYMRPSNEKLKDDPYDKNMGVYEAKEDDEDDEEDGEGAGDNENEDEDLDEASCNHTSEGVMCEVHGMKECNMESCDDKPMAGRNLKNKDGKQLLLDKSKKKLEEINKKTYVNAVRSKLDWDDDRGGDASKIIDRAQKHHGDKFAKDLEGVNKERIRTYGRDNLADKTPVRVTKSGMANKSDLAYRKRSMQQEAWEVKHADGSVENFNNQRDAYRAHQRSSGSTLGATHGAMGQKAASALGWDEYTKGRSEFKGPLRDEPKAKKTRREETVNEACWSGYEKRGMKKKGDRMVPNCVPAKEETVSEGKDSLYHVSWGTGVEHQVVAKHHDDAVSKAKDAIMKKTPKLKDEKYSDTFSKKPAVHNISKEKEAMKWQKHRLGEVVDMKDTGEVIHDFVHSKNPKFAGKSKAERIRMALGASYAAKRGTKKEDSGDSPATNNDYAGPGAAGWTTGRMPTGTL